MKPIAITLTILCACSDAGDPAGGADGGEDLEERADAAPRPDASPDGCDYRLGAGAVRPGPDGGGPVALDDLDHDGDLDLAISSRSSNLVGVLPGIGGGSLAGAITKGLPYPTGGITIAQLDPDGALDLVVSRLEGSGVSILRGNGNGTVDEALSGEAPGPLAAIDAGNVDGDPSDEILAASACDSNRINLFQYQDGAFAIMDESFAVGACPRPFVADLDGDGDQDLVAVSGSTGEVHTVLADGSLVGGGEPTTVAEPSAFVAGPVAMIDLDGHSGPDLVATTGEGIAFALGSGDGHFALDLPVDIGQALDQLAVADLDDDGDLDVIALTASGSQVAAFLSDGQGALTFASLSPTGVAEPATGIAAGDLDDDGVADAVISYAGGDSVAVHRGSCQ